MQSHSDTTVPHAVDLVARFTHLTRRDRPTNRQRTDRALMSRLRCLPAHRPQRHTDRPTNQGGPTTHPRQTHPRVELGKSPATDAIELTNATGNQQVDSKPTWLEPISLECTHFRWVHSLAHLTAISCSEPRPHAPIQNPTAARYSALRPSTRPFAGFLRFFWHIADHAYEKGAPPESRTP